MFKFSTLFITKEVDFMHTFNVLQTEISQNEYRMNNDRNTGFDIEARRPVL